jgi:hypothetical protein
MINTPSLPISVLLEYAEFALKVIYHTRTDMENTVISDENTRLANQILEKYLLAVQTEIIKGEIK